MQQLLLALIIILIIASVSDIKKQTVPLALIIAVIIIGSGVMLLRISAEGWQETKLITLAIGGLFLIFPGVFKNSWGIGDSLLILGLAEATRLDTFTGVLFWAFALSGIISLILIVLKKADRSTRIPFVPFLTAGLIIMSIY